MVIPVLAAGGAAMLPVMAAGGGEHGAMASAEAFMRQMAM